MEQIFKQESQMDRVRKWCDFKIMLKAELTYGWKNFGVIVSSRLCGVDLDESKPVYLIDVNEHDGLRIGDIVNPVRVYINGLFDQNTSIRLFGLNSSNYFVVGFFKIHGKLRRTNFRTESIYVALAKIPPNFGRSENIFKRCKIVTDDSSGTNKLVLVSPFELGPPVPEVEN
jgi:hypothetical protein